jgi:spermidine/putrescine transport system permease protein
MNKQRWGIFYSGPLTFWLSFFFLIPIGIIIYYSLMSRDVYGGVKHFTLSWNAYASMADPSFIQVLITTLWISVLSTVLTIVIALPSAYYMARSKNATFLLLLIIVPFWINFLIRIFAWMAILGTEGFLNDILKFFGVVDEGIQFLYNPVAVIIVFVYSYLPYAILPLYSTIEKFDFSLLEAARDLGATHRQSLIKVMLPAIRPGILTAVLFTFIPTFGAYAVPQLVGDKNTWMLGNVIAYELLRNRDYPKASAISILITVLTAVILLVYLFLQRRSSEIEKKGLLNE